MPPFALIAALALHVDLPTPMLVGRTVLPAGRYDVDWAESTSELVLKNARQTAVVPATRRSSKAAVKAREAQLRPVTDEPRSLLVVRAPPAVEWVASLAAVSRLAGTYEPTDGNQNPQVKGPFTQAQVKTSAGVVRLEPNWAPASRRGDAERRLFAGKRIQVDGVAHGKCPAPPEAIAYITSPCLSPVLRIEAADAAVLAGTAFDAKAGAVLELEGGTPVYLEGWATWPAAQRGKQLTVSGRLSLEPFLPVASTTADGAISQGAAAGSQFVLRSPHVLPAK